MKKLLSSLLDKKEARKLAKVSRVANQKGALANHAGAPLELYIEQWVEQHDGLLFTTNFRYTCACEQPDFKLMTKDFGYACNHCDSICELDEKKCKSCKMLNSVDFGAPKEGDENPKV